MDGWLKARKAAGLRNGLATGLKIVRTTRLGAWLEAQMDGWLKAWKAAGLRNGLATGLKIVRTIETCRATGLGARLIR